VEGKVDRILLELYAQSAELADAQGFRVFGRDEARLLR
jgi:hypothetical protein